MDNMLKGLFGGGQDENQSQGQSQGGGTVNAQSAHDFINRYMQGDPSQGYSNEEAMNHLQQAASQATPEQMQRAAQQAVQNMPANQRAELEQMLQQRQAGQGMVQIEQSGNAGAASMGNDPLGGLLGGLLGGGGSGGGGGLGGLLGGLLGGSGGSAPTSSSTGAQQGGGMFGGLGDLMNSTAGKALMGGIAAYAMKEILDSRK